MDINDYFTQDELNKAAGVETPSDSDKSLSSIAGELVNEWTTFKGGNPYRPNAMDKAEEDKLRRNETLLGRLSAESYDPNGSFATEGLGDFVSLADIARSADPRDKIKKFSEYFPDSQIRMENVNGTNVLLARRKTDPRWVKFDEGFGGFVGESLNFAEAGAFAGEAAGAALGGGLGSIVTGPLGSGAGYLLGTVLDKAIEKFRGYGENISVEPTTEDIFTAALGSGISFLGRPLQYATGKAGQYLSGIDVVPQTDEIKTAIQFAKDNGLPIPTVGSAALGGIVKAQYKQALALGSSIFDEAIKRPIAARQELLDRIAKYGVDNVSPDVIDDVMSRTAIDIDTMLSSIRTGNIDINDVGAELDGLFKNWDSVNTARLDAMYSNFRKTYGDDISFDLTNVIDRRTGTAYDLQKEVKKILSGLTLKGQDKTVPTGLLTSTGTPITKVVSEDVKVSIDPEGKLAKLMESITKLDPDVSQYTTKAGGTTSAFDAIKELRTQFRILSESNDPYESYLAGQMHSKMNDVIDSVIVNHPDPAETLKALDAWKNMSKEYKNFMDTKDISVVHKLESMDPVQRADVANSLLRPGRYESVKLVSELLGPKGKDTLRSMFFTRLSAGKEMGTWDNQVQRVFDEFAKKGDKKTLEYLFSPDEISTLKNWGVARDKLEESALRNYAIDNTAAANAIKLATSGDVASLKELASLTATDTKVMDSVRAGFLQHLVDASSVQVPKYGQQMHIKKYDAVIDKYTNNGTLEVLFPDPAQREFLTKGLRDYVAVTGDVTSVGSSLQIAEQAAQGARVITEVPEAIVAGKESKALKVLYKTIAMTIPQKTLGRFFLKEAELQGPNSRNRAASLVGEGLTKVSTFTNALKKVLQFGVYSNSVHSEKEMQKYSAPELNESMGFSPTLF